MKFTAVLKKNDNWHRGRGKSTFSGTIEKF